MVGDIILLIKNRYIYYFSSLLISGVYGLLLLIFFGVMEGEYASLIGVMPILFSFIMQMVLGEEFYSRKDRFIALSSTIGTLLLFVVLFLAGIRGISFESGIGVGTALFLFCFSSHIYLSTETNDIF